MIYAYLFEAKGVQRYLFTSGRLRDVVGASDMVSRIAASDKDDLIGLVMASGAAQAAVVDEITTKSGPNQVSFSRRAGAAFCLHCSSKETLIAIRREMRLRVMRTLPGLEISDAFGEGVDEIASMKDAFANSGGARANMAASVLPLGRPVMAIVPRTGMPQAGIKIYGGETERLDTILKAQRDRADVLQSLMGSNGIDGVAKRFNGDDQHAAKFVYPRNLDDKDADGAENPIFPWREGNDRRVGMVHADLSGLGEAFANAKPAKALENLELGKNIENAIVKAVVKTNSEILASQAKTRGNFGDIVPARPIVIGGDDITLIVRADLAVPFAARFLELIEEMSQTDELKKKIPNGLSAGAGVAIAHNSLPFLTMNALAESLCSFAKKKAKSITAEQKGDKPWPSMLAFHVQSQTAEEDYGRHIHPTLEVRGAGALTDNPYAVGKWVEGTGALPHAKLSALAKAINDVPGARNTLRQIRGDIANDRMVSAGSLWHRMFSRSDRGDKQAPRITAFRDAFEEVFGEELSEHKFPEKSGALFDALDLIKIGTLDPEATEKPLKEAAA